MTKEITYNRAKVWQIALFALNNSATNLFFLLMTFVSYYVNGVAGIAVVTVSFLLTAMRIFDGFTDPIIGFFIDKTDSKFGKIQTFNGYWIFNHGF
ncbi:MAG: MFS transporter [Oscillospiraceae bacterium]